MIVSPLPWVHLHADWSEQGLDSYRLLREQRRDGLRSVSPRVGRRGLAEGNPMDAYFPLSPFLSSFIPFISPFIPPISSAKERGLKPTRHMTAMTDNMIFFIETLLCDSER